jgi:uncharacterized membrane protein (DUF4010 family)
LAPDRELNALFESTPRYVWLMIVFVSGVSFVAYVLGRVIGVRRRIAATGVLGWFVSSTAMAVSMAEQAVEEHSRYRICVFSISIASIMVFPRALTEVTVVDRDLFPHAVVPLGAMTGFGGSWPSQTLSWRPDSRGCSEHDSSAA